MDPVLDATDRQKLIDGDDREFYASPRFVHHVDETFRARLTDLYRREIPADARVLDLMSSWSRTCRRRARPTTPASSVTG